MNIDKLINYFTDFITVDGGFDNVRHTYTIQENHLKLGFDCEFLDSYRHIRVSMSGISTFEGLDYINFDIDVSDEYDTPLDNTDVSLLKSRF